MKVPPKLSQTYRCKNLLKKVQTKVLFVTVHFLSHGGLIDRGWNLTQVSTLSFKCLFYVGFNVFQNNFVFIFQSLSFLLLIRTKTNSK